MLNDSEKKNPGILDAPPRTTFFLGLFVGITATAILAIIIMVPMLNNDGNKTAGTNNTGTALANTDAGIDTTGDTAITPSFTAPSSDSDYYRGEKPEDADIVLVEYSDYQCPFCQTLHPTMKQLMTDYDGKISWVYRHYPLTSIHPNAQPAAEAAECVGNLGGNDAFWEFTDAMFANQSSMSDTLYEQSASAAGVNVTKFKECYAAKQYTTTISTDISEGSASGINGTPGTFVLMGNDVNSAQLISGALPIDSFKQAIDSIL